MGVGAGILLSGVDGSMMVKVMVKVMEKTMTHLTKYIPNGGFVNGFTAMTKADLVVLILTRALIPFGATLDGYDFGEKLGCEIGMKMKITLCRESRQSNKKSLICCWGSSKYPTFHIKFPWSIHIPIKTKQAARCPCPLSKSKSI
jgi:hypothetical protein